MTILETQCTVAQHDVVALPSSLLKCDAKNGPLATVSKKVTKYLVTEVIHLKCGGIFNDNFITFCVSHR